MSRIADFLAHLRPNEEQLDPLAKWYYPQRGAAILPVRTPTSSAALPHSCKKPTSVVERPENSIEIEAAIQRLDRFLC
jgi:hypothetical protein